MTELNFSTGVKTYTVNETCEISFNPTDSFFVERLFNTFDALDKKQEEFRAQVGGMTDNREIFPGHGRGNAGGYQRYFWAGRLRGTIPQHERLRHGRRSPGLGQFPVGCY